LFTLLPKELRDLIFEYAFTDDKAQSLDSLVKRDLFSKPRTNIKNYKPTNDIAVNLLRTCRSIYLEAWSLPLSLNPFIVYDVKHPEKYGTQAHDFAPWQLALVQGLDITLQQASLEGNNKLQSYIRSWHPEKRHAGVYVCPKRYKSIHGTLDILGIPKSFNTALFPIDQQSNEPRHFFSYVLGNNPLPPEDTNLIPSNHPRPELDRPSQWSSAMRVLRARPLTHLTLRIQHTDWWTWTDTPGCANERHHLGLDPTIGDGRGYFLARPTAPRMRALAESRRSGHHPEMQPGVGWAHTVGMMPDLKSLELVLETFAVKKRQLEDVVDAAKTWKFPIVDTLFELVWDGEVSTSSWSMRGLSTEQQGGAWHNSATEFELRVVRFVRRRVA
jgi:hypothetical protein